MIYLQSTIILLIVLFPVLLPATITAFHALAEIRTRRKRSRAARHGFGYAADPITASA